MRVHHLVAAAIAVVLLAAGCTAASQLPTAPVTSAADEASTAAGKANTYATWDDALAAAKGTTVNWYMWGGSDVINTNVDTDIGAPLKEQFDVTLNRVPIDNTADAVNKVLNEKAAGKDGGGSVDLIWINGQNFRTLKDAGLLYGPFTDLLPNGTYVDWTNPAVANDFGIPVDGYESPWAAFQFVMEYNTAAVGDTPPATGPLAPLSWLTGCWWGDVNKHEFREYWHPLRGDMMIGVSRLALPERVTSFEYLRLESRPDGVYYVNASKGRNELAFKLTSTTKEGDDELFKFTTEGTGFPNSILYRRAGGGWLYVEVAGMAQGQDHKVIYPFRRVSCETGEFIRK